MEAQDRRAATAILFIPSNISYKVIFLVPSAVALLRWVFLSAWCIRSWQQEGDPCQWLGPMGPAILGSCDTHGPVLLEENKPFTRQRSQQRGGGMWDAFKVKESRLSTSPSIHSLAVQGKSRTSLSPGGALLPSASIPSLQLNQHFPWKRQLGKEIHVRLRRTKSMVKARYHAPGISAIPIE